MKLFMLTLLMIFSSIITTQASGPTQYYNEQTKTYSYATIVANSSDQDRCQAEANYMAANNITGHVWGVIGNFEGIGCGKNPNCKTCTPNNKMTLTGDASAQGRNGKWYRVRSWR